MLECWAMLDVSLRVSVGYCLAGSREAVEACGIVHEDAAPRLRIAGPLRQERENLRHVDRPERLDVRETAALALIGPGGAPARVRPVGCPHHPLRSRGD